MECWEHIFAVTAAGHQQRYESSGLTETAAKAECIQAFYAALQKKLLVLRENTWHLRIAEPHTLMAQ